MASFCSAVTGGVWATELENGFGAYTPCIADIVVVCLSNIVLCCIMGYQIRLILRGQTVKRFRIVRPFLTNLLIALCACVAICPIIQMALGISFVNLDGGSSIPPYEIVTSIVVSITWFMMMYLLYLETKVYVMEFRWYVRFGIIYVLVAQATMFRFEFNLRDYYDWTIFILCAGYFTLQVVCGVALVFYFPELSPYEGQQTLSSLGDKTKAEVNMDYQPLPQEDQVFPERHASIFSQVFFSWMTPLMKMGYRKPLVNSDIWRLDTWDETEVLYANFKKYWEMELVKPKPWLLRALHRSNGGRYGINVQAIFEESLFWVFLSSVLRGAFTLLISCGTTDSGLEEFSRLVVSDLK